VDNFVESIANSHFQIVGSELVLGKVYEKSGFLLMGHAIILEIWFYAGWSTLEAN